jgi:hypothetical protein
LTAAAGRPLVEVEVERPPALDEVEAAPAGRLRFDDDGLAKNESPAILLCKAGEKKGNRWRESRALRCVDCEQGACERGPPSGSKSLRDLLDIFCADAGREAQRCAMTGRACPRVAHRPRRQAQAGRPTAISWLPSLSPTRPSLFSSPSAAWISSGRSDSLPLFCCRRVSCNRLRYRLLRALTLLSPPLIDPPAPGPTRPPRPLALLDSPASHTTSAPSRGDSTRPSPTRTRASLTCVFSSSGSARPSEIALGLRRVSPELTDEPAAARLFPSPSLPASKSGTTIRLRLCAPCTLVYDAFRRRPKLTLPDSPIGPAVSPSCATSFRLSSLPVASSSSSGSPPIPTRPSASRKSPASSSGPVRARASSTTRAFSARTRLPASSTRSALPKRSQSPCVLESRF